MSDPGRAWLRWWVWEVALRSILAALAANLLHDGRVVAGGVGLFLLTVRPAPGAVARCACQDKGDRCA